MRLNEEFTELSLSTLHFFQTWFWTCTQPFSLVPVYLVQAAPLFSMPSVWDYSQPLLLWYSMQCLLEFATALVRLKNNMHIQIRCVMLLAFFLIIHLFHWCPLHNAPQWHDLIYQFHQMCPMPCCQGGLIKLLTHWISTFWKFTASGCDPCTLKVSATSFNNIPKLQNNVTARQGFPPKYFRQSCPSSSNVLEPFKTVTFFFFFFQWRCGWIGFVTELNLNFGVSTGYRARKKKNCLTCILFEILMTEMEWERMSRTRTPFCSLIFQWRMVV